MNLQRLEYFLVTAEEMNFTRAAEKLFITQQALSSYIKRLEEEYNVKLFERKPTLHLTPEGEEMVFYGKQILKTEQTLRATFSDIRENYRGKIQLGISRLRSEAFFPAISQRFHQEYPNIAIEIVDGNSNRFSELLNAGKIDLYLGINVDDNPVIKRQKLVEEQIICCFTKQLLEQYYPENWQELLHEFQAQGVDLTKIINLPLMTMMPGNRIRTNLDLFFGEKQKPYFKLCCNQQKLLYEAAKASSGAALMSPIIPYQFRYEQAALPDLYILPLANKIPTNKLYLVSRTDYALPQHVLQMQKIITEIFQKYASTID